MAQHGKKPNRMSESALKKRLADLEGHETSEYYRHCQAALRQVEAQKQAKKGTK